MVVALLAASSCIACNPGDGSGSFRLPERRLYVASSHDSLVRTDGGAADADSYAIVLPLGTQREDFALIGSNEVRVGARAKVHEPRKGSFEWGAGIASMGSTSIGTAARIGSVYSLGRSPVSIGCGVSISGYVKAAGTVQQGAESLVRVGVLEGAPDSLEVYSWQVRFPPNAEARDVLGARGKLIELAPGTYRNVSIQAGAALLISSGHYYLQSLDVQSGSRLVFDNASGPTYIWIREQLKFAGESRRSSGSLDNVLFGFGGTHAPTIDSPFHGTLIAPRSQVRLPATSRQHEGSFFAASIVVDDDAVIEHRTFDDEPPTIRASTLPER